MTFKDYYKLSAKWEQDIERPHEYYAMSLIEEFGEAFTHIRKNLFHGKPLPDNHRDILVDEVGDLMWFLCASMRYRHKAFVESLSLDIDRAIERCDSREDKIANIVYELSLLLTDLANESGDSFEMTMGFLLVRLLRWLKHDYGISLSEILDYNYKKLSERHGESYNRDWYLLFPKK